MAGVKMPDPDLTLVDDVRAASRLMVRELGFMESTLAATDHPPSAVHTILEIGLRGPLTAMQLGTILHLEKSSISRMVRKLVDSGELQETVDPADARIKPLCLTAKGRKTLAALHAFGRQQVRGALSSLSKAERQTVREGLLLYARALETWRATDRDMQSPD
ncbi:winged helix-turn-helix transcriptional regulator [Bradyrhizobium sp. 83012]|uniref:Winged helix-turn-helix transcriptional regulator n=2 Tax=Bradyrhizobium aeschynomenes TaxID=2734909 RepID=A0ABX2CQ93_9BRAD|nr:MarR family winged helix-turn-helix transcriptional regulator [Bradyrhizobium aeschynomenes]NPU15229.1 winged helix-turn-helix transcriptional regulator [Bradyrhizobium aeschynomenes]NPU69579.1 winged helix-turn-helix transcriptional regulator [Bradyrhizobium aeschynomenes]NPV24596.1 winged helix-turn-helix transcriptional regulator [Bradyrhizobium aeschynomenes]